MFADGVRFKNAPQSPFYKKRTFSSEAKNEFNLIHNGLYEVK